ncbi:MAG: sodium/solute symporter [Candidatus Eisenbacteria bacterium]|nr:sodium/solute symporter [Candidatus Eisenbacteria bacterium]
MSGTVASLVGYLAVVILIGVLSARRSSRSLSEFYLGGRTMSDFVVALSAVVSGRSAWLMMGVVGATFVLGVRMAWFIPGYVIAELLMFLFAARRIRRFTERHDNVTLLDYFASRFRDESGLLRVTAAVIIVVFFTAYVGAQLKAGQVMFNYLFGWESVVSGIALMALIVGFYTIVGGYRAVSITDAIQAVLMLLGLGVLPIVGFLAAGGPGEAWRTLAGLSRAAAAEGGTFSMLGFGSLAGVVSGLSIGLGSPGNPHIIVRYMSIRRAQRLRMAALVGTIWNVLLGWGAVYTGLAARALYQPATLPDPNNQAFVHMATDLFPPVLAGLMLAALIAAIMSTADSQILVVSSSITRDLYEKVIRRGREVTPRAAVRLGRTWAGLVILAAGLLSWLTAAYAGHRVFSTVFSYVLLAWAGLGSSFGPPLLLSLYWRRATKAGAFASFLTGTGGCILWIALGLKAATGLHEMLVGFALSLVVMIAVSLATPPPEGAAEMLAQMRSGEPSRRAG